MIFPGANSTAERLLSTAVNNNTVKHSISHEAEGKMKLEKSHNVWKLSLTKLIMDHYTQYI